MQKFKGTGVALVTPFNNDFSIDYLALERLLVSIIDGGVDYIVLMGTTAESAVLSKEEKKNIISFCVDFNKGRLPIVVGIGGNNTLSILEEIKDTDFNNIDAILSVSPYYNKPTQEGIYQHFKMISDVTPIPIIIYNVPSRTSSNINYETTLRLAKDFDNIIAIKEASGDLEQVMSIIKNKPADFLVLSGDDSLTLPMIYMGGQGVISVIAQSHPLDFSTMVRLALKGKIKEANNIHYSLQNFYKPIYEEGNPVGIKAFLEVKGVCDSTVRPPLIKASQEIIKQFSLLNK